MKTRNALLPLAAALALVACGGGGGGSATPTTSGRAVDGYLSGSTVFCDANRNGVQDTGETSTTTDGNGNFSFSGSCGGLLVVSGGTDTATGHAFKGFLKAVPGSAYVTPLTTMLADTGLTQAQLNVALGLPANTDVTRVDPMAAGNEEILRQTLVVQQVLQQLANFFVTLTNPAALPSLYTKAANALAAAIVASPGTPLVSSSTMDDGILTDTV